MDPDVSMRITNTWASALIIVLLLVLFSRVVNAESALEDMLGSTTGSSDYAERMHRLVDDSERATVHAGIGALMLMNLLDDEIEFGYSDYWYLPVGTTGDTSIACALGGGIDSSATRDDYRKISGTLNFNNCTTTLGVLNGSADFSYDDSIWDSQANPKIDYALILNLQSVSLESNDGQEYRFQGGGAFCDSKINFPLHTDSYSIVFSSVTRSSFGRDPQKQMLSDYEFYSEFSYDVEDSFGRLKENLASDFWNCDLKNISVELEGKRHTIRDVKFYTDDFLYGEYSSANYIVTNGRDSRLSQIGSGAKETGGWPQSGRFEHDTFGSFAASSGRLYFGDYGYKSVPDEQYPSGVRLDFFYYQNSLAGTNTWSLEQGRLSGGNLSLGLADLNENGLEDSYERINNGFELTRGECALNVLGDASSPPNYFELQRRDSSDELLNTLRPGTGCYYANNWRIESSSNGDFVSYFQLDNEQDGIHDYYDRDDDNDGVEDGEDAFPRDGSEWTDTDLDGIGNNADTDDDNDGVKDSGDAFPLDPSETRDTDGDGIGNNADIDDDGDGYNDKSDRFPLNASEWIDTDDDGEGNNADVDDDNDGLLDQQEIRLGTNELLADTDGDGMDDGLEVDGGLDPLDDSDCPTWYCPTLAPSILITQSGSYDFDSDGLTRNEEETLGTDFRLADSDGDGLTDGAEVQAGSDPLIQDTDGDGLLDKQEVELGLNPTSVDSDGDSMDDGEEVKEGLDPSDDSDCPRWYCGSSTLPQIIRVLAN